jgi:hypothetical protein
MTKNQFSRYDWLFLTTCASQGHAGHNTDNYKETILSLQLTFVTMCALQGHAGHNIQLQRNNSFVTINFRNHMYFTGHAGHNTQSPERLSSLFSRRNKCVHYVTPMLTGPTDQHRLQSPILTHQKLHALSPMEITQSPTSCFQLSKPPSLGLASRPSSTHVDQVRPRASTPMVHQSFV